MKKLIYTILITILSIVPVFAEEENITESEYIINNLPKSSCLYNNEIKYYCNLNSNNGDTYYRNEFETTTFIQVLGSSTITLKVSALNNNQTTICFYTDNFSMINCNVLTHLDIYGTLIDIPQNTSYLRISYYNIRKVTIIVSYNNDISQINSMNYAILEVNKTIVKAVVNLINNSIFLIIIGISVIFIIIYFIRKIGT